jgi:hypothetical protein
MLILGLLLWSFCKRRSCQLSLLFPSILPMSTWFVKVRQLYERLRILEMVDFVNEHYFANLFWHPMSSKSSFWPQLYIGAIHFSIALCLPRCSFCWSKCSLISIITVLYGILCKCYWGYNINFVSYSCSFSIKSLDSSKNLSLENRSRERARWLPSLGISSLPPAQAAHLPTATSNGSG